MNEVAVNREAMRRVRDWCDRVRPGLRERGVTMNDGIPKSRDGAQDEDFWIMTAVLVPGVIRASGLDPYRETSTGAPASTPQAGPEPAPTESEAPPSGDRQPSTGTAPEAVDGLRRTRRRPATAAQCGRRRDTDRRDRHPRA